MKYYRIILILQDGSRVPGTKTIISEPDLPEATRLAEMAIEKGKQDADIIRAAAKGKRAAVLVVNQVIGFEFEPV